MTAALKCKKTKNKPPNLGDTASFKYLLFKCVCVCSYSLCTDLTALVPRMILYYCKVSFTHTNP